MREGWTWWSERRRCGVRWWSLLLPLGSCEKERKKKKKKVSISRSPRSSAILPSPSLLPLSSDLNTLPCPLPSPLPPLFPFIILVNEVFLKKRSTKLMQLKVDNSQISQSFNSKIAPIFTKQYFLNKEVR